jgi:hypothetical protein
MWSRRLAKRRLEAGGFARAALPFAALLLRSLHIICMCYCRARAIDAAAALIGSHAGVYLASERSPRQRERSSLPGQDADQKAQGWSGTELHDCTSPNLCTTQVGKILSKFSE